MGSCAAAESRPDGIPETDVADGGAGQIAVLIRARRRWRRWCGPRRRKAARETCRTLAVAGIASVRNVEGRRCVWGRGLVDLQPRHGRFRRHLHARRLFGEQVVTGLGRLAEDAVLVGGRGNVEGHVGMRVPAGGRGGAPSDGAETGSSPDGEVSTRDGRELRRRRRSDHYLLTMRTADLLPQMIGPTAIRLPQCPHWKFTVSIRNSHSSLGGSLARVKIGIVTHSHRRNRVAANPRRQVPAVRRWAAVPDTARRQGSARRCRRRSSSTFVSSANPSRPDRLIHHDSGHDRDAVAPQPPASTAYDSAYPATAVSRRAAAAAMPRPGPPRCVFRSSGQSKPPTPSTSIGTSGRLRSRTAATICSNVTVRRHVVPPPEAPRAPARSTA